jgi:hypothetical protein
MEGSQLSLHVSPSQVIDLARKLSRADKDRLMAVLTRDTEEQHTNTHLISEAALAKDWLTDQEDQTWQHL